MSIFRITHTDFEEKFNVINGDPDTFHEDEWENSDRIHEAGWKERYEYEATLIVDVIEQNNVKSVLEIGSGPGMLSQMIQEKVDVEYHLIDKIFAQKFFEKNEYKGKFFVKDISLDLNLDGLNETYDLIVCNDVLEHLMAPSMVTSKIYNLMHDTSVFFISLPNWRMSHQFIYRGVWDYDNFIYFLYIHSLQPTDVQGSLLQTPFYEKLDSEQTMPDELLRSWNFYFTGKKLR